MAENVETTTGDPTIVNQIVINKEKYNVFLKCLDMIKDICNDVDIKHGIIRQRLNDNNTIIEIDLTSILGDIDVTILGIKQKIKLIEYFADEINISITEESDPNDNTPLTSIEFRDQYSKIKFMNPQESWLDNSFITSETFNETVELLPESLILDQRITSTIAYRIKTTILNFNAYRVSLVCNGDHADLFIKTKNHDTATFLKNILTNTNIECQMSILPVPFMIDGDHEFIDFKIYYTGENNLSWQSFSFNTGGVDINIYTLCRLTSLNE